MKNWFSRLRHSRGFGIHSPFAFRFVTECLCERTPYYDYASLPSRAERTLYRVACRMQPLVVATAGGADATAALLACPRARLGAIEEADMIVVDEDASQTGLQDVADAMGREAVVYVQGPHRTLMAELQRVLAALGCGMTFDNYGDTAVVVPRRKLPRQDFDVKF